MLMSPHLDLEAGLWLLRDSGGEARAALICWSVALSAFVMLRIPREVLLGCLIVAGATVGLAATIEMAPDQATAGARQPEMVAARGQTAAPFRGLRPPARERPY